MNCHLIMVEVTICVGALFCCKLLNMMFSIQPCVLYDRWGNSKRHSVSIYWQVIFPLAQVTGILTSTNVDTNGCYVHWTRLVRTLYFLQYHVRMINSTLCDAVFEILRQKLEQLFYEQQLRKTWQKVMVKLVPEISSTCQK